MVLEFDNHRIITDDLQFILQEKKTIEKGNFTKEENIGKEYWKNIGYYTTLKNALKQIPKEILLKNKTSNIILNKLNELDNKINIFIELKEEEK